MGSNPPRAHILGALAFIFCATPPGPVIAASPDKTANMTKEEIAFAGRVLDDVERFALGFPQCAPVPSATPTSPHFGYGNGSTFKATDNNGVVWTYSLRAYVSSRLCAVRLIRLLLEAMVASKRIGAFARALGLLLNSFGRRKDLRIV